MLQRALPAYPGGTSYRPGWEEKALCKGVDTRIFFPENENHSSKAWAAARWYCNHCPVIDECREAAMKREGIISFEHRYGMLGGLTPWGRFKAACPERAARIVQVRNEWHLRNKAKRERELIAQMEAEGNEGSPAQE
jgi:hypothetical protein